MTRNKILSNKIYPLLFLTVTVLISVTLLVLVNSVASPVITSQQEAEIKKMLIEIFPGMDDYKYEDDLYTIFTESENTGYAFIANGKGYGGNISILVGIDSNLLIKEVIIVSDTETPGLGSRISEKSFTDQFQGLAADDVVIKKEGGKVDAITGATISSKAVTAAVRNVMAEKIEIINNK